MFFPHQASRSLPNFNVIFPDDYQDLTNISSFDLFKITDLKL